MFLKIDTNQAKTTISKGFGDSIGIFPKGLFTTHLNRLNLKCIKMKKVICLMVSIGILTACTQDVWPPPKVNMPADFKPDAQVKFNKSVNMKNHMALVLDDCKIRLPFNLFAIKKPITEEPSENQFEVLYYDDKQTFIKADSAKQDKILLVFYGMGSFGETYTYIGTRVRYQGKIYEIKPDGWYVGGKNVAPFKPDAK